MSKIFFWIKKDSSNEWNTIEKALGHKYVKRIPNPTGKTKWYYIYAETFKKPFKALAEIFGIKETRINVDYDKENINKEYGVDKQTFAAHILEYFTNKEKWNKIFGTKLSRDKYKEPIKQKELAEYVEKVGGETADKKDAKPKKKNIINRTLMRKVWTLYSSEGKQIEQKEKDIKNLESDAEKTENRSDAMKGNQNAKKYGLSDSDMQSIHGIFNEIHNDSLTGNDLAKLLMIDNEDLWNKLRQNKARESENISIGDILFPLYKEYKEKQNGQGANNTEQGRVSERDSDIRRERGIGSSGNGDEAENRADGSKSELDTTELGIGLGIGENVIRLQPGRGIPGQRLTKSEIKDIRSQVKELLNSKKDDEFTEADKALLRQYEGAGGLGENDASVSGTLYEYYTPQNVVNKVWELVDKYNPKQDKKVIEPSSGTGRFAEGRSENFTMFELEEDSSRINKILHPNAKVVQGYFQENFIKDGMFTGKNFEKFDVAVGNPPYGKYEGRYKGLGEGKGHTRIDEYFLDRTLDTLKDGGILAMVVPSSFLSSKDSKIKQKLEGKANLLEAWRLPNGTFGTTGVGTDIIILKKEKGVPGSLSNGTYFANNPSCIVGTETERTGRFGNLEKYVALNPGQTFDEAIATISTDAIAVDKKDIPIAVTEIKQQPEWVGKVTTINRKTGKVTRTDKATGKVTVLKEGDAEKKANRSEAMKGNKNAEGEHDVQNIIGTIMDAEKFNAKYGKNLSKEELDIWKVSDVDGYVNTNALSDELRNYVEKSGNYIQTQTGKWEHVANYASGNVVEKLESLESEYADKTDKEYILKKSILEKVLPTQKNIDQLDLSPLENWTRDYKVDVLGQEVSLIDAFYLWVYNGHNYYDRSDSPVTPFEIPAQISWNDIHDYINKVPVRKDRVSKDADKNDRDYAERKAQQTRDLRRITAEKLFNRFLKDGLNQENAKELCTDWNRQFNSHVNPDYKKIPVFVNGMCSHKGSKEFTLLDQQIKGISFLANKGSGLLAYDVGVGKTAAGIVATVNQIQTGRSKKPLICVPKAVYKKWIKEIHQHFPNQKVFEIGNLGSQYFKPGDTIPEGAITVCTYEALKKMTFKEDTIAEISEDAEYNAINPYNSKTKKTARDIANEKNKVDTLVGEMSKTTGKDAYYFEDLGFDHITVDEVHNFKNVFSLPRNYKLGKDEDDDTKEANEFSKIRGSSSDRGKKMFAITQYIQRHNDNRNVYALSATPFTNSPTEIYSMLSLVARHRLRELGIFSLHEFLAKFAELRTEYVVQPDNSIKEEQVVKSFKKLQALQNLISEYIDKVDGDEAKVIRPQKVTHTPELALSDLQKQMIQEQIDYMQNAPADDTAATIVAMNNMRMITLAPAIVDSSLLDQFVESSPKLKFVCDSIIEQYKKNPKNGQVIYMPRGVEHFDKVVDYLVKNGLPQDAVGVMAGGASNEKELNKREELKDDFNKVDGKCKVLIGSGTIQEGVSLNGNATTLYNCMLCWNPSETQQVEGRIWRQGNKQGVTHIVYPLMNDSIDALMYQKYDEKQSRIDALWKYKGDSLNVSDIDPEELKFGLIKDPEKRADLQIIQEKERLDNDIRQLGMQIDILHKNEKLAFDTDVETECMENYDYKRAKDQVKEDSYLIESINEYKSNVDNGEVLKKKLAKMDETEHFTEEMLKESGISEDEYYRVIGGHNSSNVTVKDVKKTIVEFIKDNDESYKNAKQRKVSYERIIKKEEKRVTDLITSAKEALKRQSINNKETLEGKIKDLSEDMSNKKSEVDKMKDKREEYKQKAIEDIKKNQKTIPKISEMVKQNVEAITSTLRPMDEVKAWIQEGRASGKSKDQISREINERIGVKKSWCYFAKDKNGQIKMYVKKSIVDNFVNSN